MKAAVVQDGAIVVAEKPDPVPAAGQLLIKVAAAGINGADLLQRRGGYPPPPGVPADVPGLELAGEVVGVGAGARRFTPGERVMAVVGGAGQAELAVVHEREAMPVPPGMGMVEAGGFPETFTTAHDALFSQCELQTAERLLVRGASGGVGTAAVQLGVAAGAQVTATTRHPEHFAALAAMGARVTADDVVAANESEGEGPFDVVLELVGASNMEKNVRSLATGGRISVIGVSAGARFDLNLLELMQARGRVMGSTLRSRTLEEKAEAARKVEKHVLPLVSSGAVRVLVHETFELDSAQEAYDRFAAGGKLGKIVLAISDQALTA